MRISIDYRGDQQTAENMQNKEEPCDEITLDDVPININSLTEEQKEQAKQYPKGEEYRVLTLKPEGAGHNTSLLAVAAKCHQMGATYDQCLEHLSSQYNQTRPDYNTAPKRAADRVWRSGGDTSKLVDSSSEARPEAKHDILAKLSRTMKAEIIAASPTQDPAKIFTLEIIDGLFAPNDIINIQIGALEAGTLTQVKNITALMRRNRKHLEDYKFLNPATFKNVNGVENPNSPTNNISTRCNANVKKRDWMVLEFDPDVRKSLEAQQADSEKFSNFAMTMAKFAPLIMALDTGGKSIHYWFDATGISKGVHTAFFNTACIHGAVKSQIARMPNTPAAAEGRNAQEVIYFDPDRDAAPGEWELADFEEAIGLPSSLDVYYNTSKQNFISRDNLETWISFDRTSLRSHLAESGYRATSVQGENITPVDKAINAVQMGSNVQAVMTAASGRTAGVYDENGTRFIVTKSPTYLPAKKGAFANISRFLDGLLDHEDDQRDVFLGWLSSSIIDLRNGGKRQATNSPAQMIHIIGEPNSGKSLLLQNILKHTFGGRMASADPLFDQKQSQFNAEMFGSELLFLDDSPVLKADFQSRQTFGERIKTHTVGVGGNYRGMYQDNINIKPWWRLIRLMNTEAGTLATLPPLDEGVEDKIILLKAASMSNGPLAGEMMIDGWFEKLAEKIENELPAFIYYLLNDYKLPAELKDPSHRFPVTSYKNPWILEEISQSSTESYVLGRIDKGISVLMPTTKAPDGEIFRRDYRGTAEDLYEALLSFGDRSKQLRFTKTCPTPGVLLSQLRNLERMTDRIIFSTRAEDYPDRYDGATYWIIKPPKKDRKPQTDINAEPSDMEFD